MQQYREQDYKHNIRVLVMLTLDSNILKA